MENRCLYRRWTWALAVALAAAGCHRAPARPAGTGARQVAQDYGTALLRRDWERAYGLLDAECRARCSEEVFARLAEGYRSGLGFEPQEIHLGACQEQGGEAVAHYTFNGWEAGRHRKYKDAVRLRKNDAGWGVVFGANFGRVPKG
jgi:hypothetical protein